MIEIRALSFTITCASCAGPVEIVNNTGRFGDREVSGVVRCKECGAKWSVRVDMVRIGQHIPCPGESDRKRQLVAVGH